MIDLTLLRSDPESVKTQLARRGVSPETLDEVLRVDGEHRQLLQEAERLRASIKDLSRQVGEARKSGDTDKAEMLSAESRTLGESERSLSERSDRAATELRDLLLRIPNIPAPDVPDGASDADNVELRRWWPGRDEGRAFPTYEEYQRVPHWDIGVELGILDLPAGAKIAGSMFPLYRGDGSRLLRALSSYALNVHADAYEELRPPSVALTQTLVATGHLPKFEEEVYAVERDDLWLIPTAEVPLTSLHRDDILDESSLPIKLTALTPCFRREAGAAGRDTRGVLRTHEFDKVELFAYCTPEQAQETFDDVLARAEALLQELGLTYQVMLLCAGDMGGSSKRTIDLNVYAPGADMWLEVSSVSWFGDYQARRANVRYRPNGGATAFVHTVNGSALAWSRIWPAIVETYRQSDGSVLIPEVLRPYLGGRTAITKRPG